MLTEEQLRIRKKGIGGSDVAAIYGVSKYKTAMDVYLDKISDDVAQISNPIFERGNILEPIIREVFARKKGLNVKITDETFSHSDYPFMIANVDGLIEDDPNQIRTVVKKCGLVKEWQDRALIEIKTSNKWTKSFENGIPDDYYLQVQHYMCVCGVDKAYVIALILDPQYFEDIMRSFKNVGMDVLSTYEDFIWKNTKVFEVQPNFDFHKTHPKKMADFWYNHVETRTPPPASTNEDVKKLFPNAESGKEIKASDHFLFLYSQYEKLRYVRDSSNAEYDKLIERLERDIMEFMRDSESVLDEFGNALITWKNQERQSIDMDKLKEEMPHIYEQFLKTKKYRTFKVCKK